MASLCYENDGHRKGYRLQFYCDRKRRSIWLGNISQTKATNVKRNVEELCEAKKQACRPDAVAIRWATNVDTRVQTQLIKIGLLDDQTKRDIGNRTLTVRAFFDRAIREKENVSDSWKTNYKQAADWLFKRIPEDKLLSELLPSECQAWHEWLLTKLSASTAGQHLKRCRQMLRSAFLDRLIPINPMEGIKGCTMKDRTKDAYIDEASAEKLLSAAVCQQWRVIIALSRFAGLRCPSEVFALRWYDVNWGGGRITVTSPKGRKIGKGERVIPLFPAVRKELEALSNVVLPGVNCSLDTRIITRYEGNSTNLRTQLGRTFKSAGLVPIGNPFNNLRASARTDLQNGGFQNHALNSWFGHSTAIANRHYLRTTDADFEKAQQFGGVAGGVD